MRYHRHNELNALRLRVAQSFFAIGVFVASANPSKAETLSGALIRAYNTNPQLNVQRADTRAVDENLPNALAGYRPVVTGSANAGILNQRTTVPGSIAQPSSVFNQGVFNPGYSQTTLTRPISGIITLTQNIFNGFRTENSVAQAKSQINSSRETLRNTEIFVLGNVAIAYMDVLRDAAIFALRHNNVKVLEQEVLDTRDLLAGGEITQTDLSQAEAALAQGRADLAIAQTNLETSEANYRQWIGASLRGWPLRGRSRNFSLNQLSSCIEIAEVENPLVLGAIENAQAASYAVGMASGRLAPTLNLVGSVGPQLNAYGTSGYNLYTATVGAQLSVPFYEGGALSTQLRQSKERLAEAQLFVDQQREQVRAAVETSWAAWVNTRTVIAEEKRQIRASEKALEGVREEARLGQRTTLDILNAQQFLLNARIRYISAQRDQVVSSYSLLASLGRLTARTLGLR